MTYNPCLCPCHNTTSVNDQGCQNCQANHGAFGGNIYDRPAEVIIHPDNNALLQKLSEILNELKEIKKRIG